MDTEKKKPGLIRLGGHDIQLVRPGYTDRVELVMANRRNKARAMFAALGLCWPRDSRETPEAIQRPKAAWDYDILAYGGRVGEELNERGYGHAELGTAIFEALHFATHETTPGNVREAEVFSEAEAGSTT